jgi:hypothetical protein
MDEKAFEQRPKETIAWCTRYTDLPKCTPYVVRPGIWGDPSVLPKLSKSAEYLRTPILRPSFYGDHASLFFADGKQAANAIEAISEKRKALLSDQQIVAEKVSMTGGRLLVHFLGTSAHDGLSEAITGYFDHEDSPPWDTWLCSVVANDTDYVLSWVPPMWIEDVEAVLHYEHMGALMWADTLVSRPKQFKIFDFQRCYVPAWLERYSREP